VALVSLVASLEGFEPTTRCLEGSRQDSVILVRICACLSPEPWAKLGEAVGLFLAITSFLPFFMYLDCGRWSAKSQAAW